MNSTFSIKRFWQYFCYELKKACNNAGVSTLILAFLPIILFLIFEVFGILFEHRFVNGHTAISGVALYIAYLVAMFAIPSKLYGSVTDKRAGTDYLMLPASRLEKYLSMVLIVGFVYPLALGVLFFAVEALVSLIPGFGAPIITELATQLSNIEFPFNLHSLTLLFFGLSISLLVFNLGAIIFKKNKAAYTFLVLLGLTQLFSWVMILFFGGIVDEPQWLIDFLERIDSNIDSLQALYNWSIAICVIISYLVLLPATWFRVKTIKH